MKQSSPIVAVDLVIFSILNNDLHVAVIQMKKKPFTGMWAFPGGLVHGSESVDDAAIRELSEKTGLTDVYLEQLYTFGEIDRDPLKRVVSVVYYALIDGTHVTLKTSSKYSDIQWLPLHELPRLSYDHNHIARVAHDRLKSKLSYANIAYSLLPKRFTLSELQKVYEIILDQPLDKRNFRKKILELRILKPTKKFRTDGAHRPALLYEFKERKPKIINIL